VIEIVELTKYYDGFCALDHLNLKIEKGDIFGYIGPNGAGKTTTIRILATLLAPSYGGAKIAGYDIRFHRREVKRLIGYMPDFFGVYDGMRLYEYLDFFAAAYKIARKKRKGMIDDVLELTDLRGKADDFVSSFSRGMKQRACLAKTLIHDPQILLLDEPASGLDPRARIEIKELIIELRSMGKTILISSHILGELADMCNKIGIIEQGKLLASGDIREIYRKVREHRTIEMELLDDGKGVEAMLKETPGITGIDVIGNLIRIQSTQTNEEVARMLENIIRSGHRVLWQREEQANLEEVFMKITKGGPG